MRGSKLRRDCEGALPRVLVIIGVAAVVLVVATLALYPWAARTSDYANDPGEPPDEVDDGDAEPAWQGKFQFGLKVGVGTDGRCNLLRIRGSDCRMGDWQDYDGEPWSTASLFDAMSVGTDLTIEYELQLRNGKTFVNDVGQFDWSRSDGSDVTHRTRWFFFWSEQAREWNWILTVKCDSISSVIQRGSFTIDESGDIK